MVLFFNFVLFGHNIERFTTFEILFMLSNVLMIIYISDVEFYL